MVYLLFLPFTYQYILQYLRIVQILETMGLFSHHNEKAGPPPDEKQSQPPPPSYGEAKEKPAFGAPQTELRAGPSVQSPTCSFAALLLSRSDRIRIMGFPPAVIGPLDEAIRRVWVLGIQNAGPYDSMSYEWKLSGRPWYGQGGEAVPARRLIIHVLHALAAIGWHLAISVDLSKKQWDKDTLIFKAGPPIQRYFFSISFNMSDKVRIIDPPNEGIKQAFIQAVHSWPLGIQDSKEKEPGCHQLKLRGNPWWSSKGEQVNQSRMLACMLLSAMDQQGFELVGSIDMSVGSSGGENSSGTSELDSWFFANKV